MSGEKTQVTIRVDKSVADELARRASREGLSRSAYAAKLVREALDEPELSPHVSLLRVNESLERIEDLLLRLVSSETRRAFPDEQVVRLVRDACTEAVIDVAEDLPAIHHEIIEHQTLHERQLEKLRKDLAKAVAVVLVNGGKADAAKAIAWVNKHLLREVDSRPAIRAE